MNKAESAALVNRWATSRMPRYVYSWSAKPEPAPEEETWTYFEAPTSRPLESVAEFSRFCSPEAVEEIGDELGTKLLLQEVFEHVTSERPDWKIFCYLSRSPEDDSNRLIVMVETQITDFDERFEKWEALTMWVVERCKYFAKKFAGGDWESIFSRFSVVMW
jgi:hypothetical protein